ncbi:uncharacterized protein C8A04DRAFT_9884 [Dichotomopilus funicola]|uniref:DUF4484 domain-containing protein n=1 Tax=Dichotomopilus funicola TaxID=1934379 RepID=A0AAN6ZPR5_9PEZI|nr:hypothetical protein C8A04DRAFT_9884 [Dichotomopilus funicola]
MAAASRRGQPPLSVHLPQHPTSPLPDLPPISALFLIDFDVKAGYTITWKQAVPGLELEGTVEYKSLPSGLHTVPDDLIYFVHDGGHAGLSAFVNTPTDEEETRHARMIAVGVLVPLSAGRLGRAWRHAEGLKSIAARLAADRNQTQLLDEYWDENGVGETTAPQPLKDIPPESPLLGVKAVRPGAGKGHARNRSASDGAALIPPGHRLSPFHPAWSLTALLDTFGPLIFPIQRAALLRKRILISCHAPVHEVCNFVYDISVLSNIPLSVCDVIDTAAPSQRLRPLFCIGVHDLSSLLEYQAPTKRSRRSNDSDDEPHDDDSAAGWVACTTDSILAMKEGLWDMLITMPPPYSSNATQRVWPTVECPKGVSVRATQRDLRRFRSLTLGLARLAPPTANPSSTRPPLASVRSPPSEASDSPVPPVPSIRLSAAASSSRPGTATATTGDRPSGFPTTSSDDDTDTIVEPTTWAALAYNGFMWWASAGEKRHSDEVDEQSHDASLLTDLAPPFSPSMAASSPHLRANRQREPSLTAAAAAPASGDMVSSLASLAAARPAGDDEEDENDTDAHHSHPHHTRRNDEAQARIELAVVAYFHRLTTSIMTVLADIVDSSDDDDLLGLGLLGGGGSGGGGGYSDYTDGPPSRGGEGSSSGGLRGRRRGHHDEDEDDTARLLGSRSNSSSGDDGNGDETSRFPWVRIDSEALAEMGLDVWSQADADFVVDVAARYFARRAYVETKGVEVCGVRVC